MSKYEEGLKLIEDRCGKGKDNIISLEAIAIEPNVEGKSMPYVRDLDAYYEDGVFYIVTWAKSTKMLQIAQNPNVAFTVCSQWFSGIGIGENLGWILDPKNGVLRTKLRRVFATWYDDANNEKDENCCVLAVHITQCTVLDNHGAVRYDMDFVNKVETSQGYI